MSHQVRYRVSVMHGVNLGALDRRPAGVYGGLSLGALEDRISAAADGLGLEVTFLQTDFEGEYVGALHRAADLADGLILNPGAWTHYSWAIGDALEISGLPAVEVHLSDVGAREAFRQVSVIAPHCFATVSGKGPDGYADALSLLKDRFTTEE